LFDSEDKAEHTALARKLILGTKCSVVVPNYRLTPKEPTENDYLHHPAHAEDILLFLNFVVHWEGPEGMTAKLYDPQRIYLIGHSCSAHMLTSIFLDSSSTTPTLTPPPSLLRAVQGIVLSEGIYDLELLLKFYPDYREWFVRSAFGEDKPLSCFATTKYALRDSSSHIRWLIIHSTGDHLINPPQSEAIFTHLSRSYGLLAEHLVSKNFDKLTGEHNDILTNDNYVEIVRDFVLIA
jgi:acetyl esterase/lipase